MENQQHLTFHSFLGIPWVPFTHPVIIWVVWNYSYRDKVGTGWYHWFLRDLLGPERSLILYWVNKHRNNNPPPFPEPSTSIKLLSLVLFGPLWAGHHLHFYLQGNWGSGRQTRALPFSCTVRAFAMGKLVPNGEPMALPITPRGPFMILSLRNFWVKIQQILLSLGIDSYFYFSPVFFPSIVLLDFADLKSPAKRGDIESSQKQILKGEKNLAFTEISREDFEYNMGSGLRPSGALEVWTEHCISKPRIL